MCLTILDQICDPDEPQESHIHFSHDRLVLLSGKGAQKLLLSQFSTIVKGFDGMFSRGALGTIRAIVHVFVDDVL